MDDSEKRLVSRYGLLIGLLILFSFLFDFILYLVTKRNISNEFFQYSRLILGVLIIFTRNNKVGKYAQFSCLIMLTSLTIWTDPTQGYGIMLLFNLLLLSKKYGFLRTNVILKLAVSFIILLVLLLSSLIAQDLPLLNIAVPLLFLIISFISCSLIMLDEIRAYFEMEKNYTLAKTETEMLLLESLCLHNESIKDLASRLEKSHHTVKTQLKNIYNKIGVESKVELVKACENYFKIRNK